MASRRAMKDGRFVLEFHGVSRRQYPGLPGLARSSLWINEFERALKWLSVRGPFLTPVELLSSNRPGVLLTFDDGFANNYDVVIPMLEKFAAPAVFFVATGHIGGKGDWLPFVQEAAESFWGDSQSVPPEVARDLYDGMTEANVAACAAHDLVTIGAHSESHPRLTAIDDKRLEMEICGSKETLENATGGSVDLFAYPFGDTNARVARQVEDAGFSAAFVETPVAVESSGFAIPRIGIHDSRSWYLSAKLSGLKQRALEPEPLI